MIYDFNSFSYILYLYLWYMIYHVFIPYNSKKLIQETVYFSVSSLCPYLCNLTHFIYVLAVETRGFARKMRDVKESQKAKKAHKTLPETCWVRAVGCRPSPGRRQTTNCLYYSRPLPDRADRSPALSSHLRCFSSNKTRQLSTMLMAGPHGLCFQV